MVAIMDTPTLINCIDLRRIVSIGITPKLHSLPWDCCPPLEIELK